jgi:hypothetical protein
MSGGGLLQLVAYGAQDVYLTGSPQFDKYATKIQRVYLKHFTRRKYAAMIISRGCHNWVWKPECNDGTIGIRPRLDMEYLGIY